MYGKLMKMECGGQRAQRFIQRQLYQYSSKK